MKIILLPFLFFSHSIYDFNHKDSNPCDCGTYESYTTSDVPVYDIGEWRKGWGPLDGTYFYANVAFENGYSGILYKGAMSDNFFVENSDGDNFYYSSERTVMRALYLYKRFGCVSSKFRI